MSASIQERQKAPKGLLKDASVRHRVPWVKEYYEYPISITFLIKGPLKAVDKVHETYRWAFIYSSSMNEPIPQDREDQNLGEEAEGQPTQMDVAASYGDSGGEGAGTGGDWETA
jgi:hypothetical protein